MKGDDLEKQRTVVGYARWRGLETDWESSLEAMFFALVFGRLHPDVHAFYQHEVIGYRLDFAFFRSGQGLGVELDGEMYHEYKRDARRDQAIIDQSDIGAVLRVPGSLIHRDRTAVLAALQHFAPGLLRTLYNFGQPDFSEVTWRER